MVPSMVYSHYPVSINISLLDLSTSIIAWNNMCTYGSFSHIYFHIVLDGNGVVLHGLITYPISVRVLLDILLEFFHISLVILIIDFTGDLFVPFLCL